MQLDILNEAHGGDVLRLLLWVIGTLDLSEQDRLIAEARTIANHRSHGPDWTRWEVYQLLKIQERATDPFAEIKAIAEETRKRVHR